MFQFALLAASVFTITDAWSVTGYISNGSPYIMYGLVANLTEGSFITQPPASINPGQQVFFEADGGRLGTTAGYVVYSVERGGPQVYLGFNVGATASYNTVAIPPNFVQYQTGSDAHGKTVAFLVTQRYFSESAASDFKEVVEAQK